MNSTGLIDASKFVVKVEVAPSTFYVGGGYTPAEAVADAIAQAIGNGEFNIPTRQSHFKVELFFLQAEHFVHVTLNQGRLNHGWTEEYFDFYYDDGLKDKIIEKTFLKEYNVPVKEVLTPEGTVLK